MGKRKRSRSKSKENDADLRKRLRRLEKKIRRYEDREDLSVSQPRSVSPPPPVDTSCPVSPRRPVSPIIPGTPPLEVEGLTEDDIPEDLIQALGKEGECREVVGEELQQHLADRWTNIIHQGLGKDARDLLIKKYLTPVNFTSAVPPIMNQEIAASMSDSSTKRDKRIIFRQTLVGKMLVSLGRALSSVLKGNLNTKEIVEQLNDSAKLAAEVFYQDSSSRKFFALTGKTGAIKEAIKNGKTDEYLFGKNCGEQIKAAQTIQKTGSTIKAGDFRPRSTRQENWRSPLPPHQQYRSGQFHRPPIKARTTQQVQRPQASRKKISQPQKPTLSRYRRY